MILPNRTCSDCRHIWRASCPVEYRKELSGYGCLPACDDYKPNMRRAVKDLKEAIIAPFIPIADRLEKWLEERGKH